MTQVAVWPNLCGPPQRFVSCIFVDLCGPPLWGGDDQLKRAVIFGYVEAKHHKWLGSGKGHGHFVKFRHERGGEGTLGQLYLDLRPGNNL